VQEIWKLWWRDRVDRINRVSIFTIMDHFKVDYRAEDTRGAMSCPFHGEDNHPSGYVYPDSNTFYCFKESKSRDALSFCWEMQGGRDGPMSFKQIVWWIEENFHLGHPDAPEGLEPDVPKVDPAALRKEAEGRILAGMKGVEAQLIESREFFTLETYQKLLSALDLTGHQFFVGSSIDEVEVEKRLTVLRQKAIYARIQAQKT